MQRHESAMMDDRIGGVRVWLTAGKHTPCSSVTATQRRWPKVTMRLVASLLVLFPLECGAPVQPEHIYHDKSTGEKSKLSHGAPSLQRSVKRLL